MACFVILGDSKFADLMLAMKQRDLLVRPELHVKACTSPSRSLGSAPAIDMAPLSGTLLRNSYLVSLYRGAAPPSPCLHEP